jgi:hypothetical protein
MQSLPVGTQRNAQANAEGYGQGYATFLASRVAAGAVLLLLSWWGIERIVDSTPTAIREVAPSRANWLFGAFRPPLEPTFRPFKDTANGAPATPSAMTLRISLGTEADSRPDAEGRWFGLDDTFAAGIQRRPESFPFNVGDPSGIGRGYMVTGAAIGDGAWAVMPVWKFPVDRFVAEPRAATFTAIPPASRATSAGDSVAWNASRPTEFADDQGGMRTDTGFTPAAAVPGVLGSIPYWRVAVAKELKRYFLQIGTYGMNAAITPGGNQSAGTMDTLTDLGFAASYQFILNPGSAVIDKLSAGATMVHEYRSLGDPNRVLGAAGFNTLDTFRAEASWSLADIVTPSVQYFRTSGSVGAIQYSWPGSRPNSAGVMAAVAYAPWDGPGSPIRFLNIRLGAQYIAYTEFNGSTRGAGANNAVAVSLSGALHF